MTIAPALLREYPAMNDAQRAIVSHGLCNRLVTTHRHRTPLGNNYETLDELTQLLFIFEHFEEIIGPEIDGRYLGKWTTQWTAIEGVRGYFDKITEELVDPARLLDASDPFLHRIGEAYLAYQQTLFRSNRLAFAHQQKLVHDLLLDSDVAEAITGSVKYVLVDEYQDTNFIQEQILLKLTTVTRNLCVVGDEDQSLYRFRGATVRNILEFTARVPGCAVVKLTTNYRCLAVLFGYYGEGRGQATGGVLAALVNYIDTGIMELGRHYGGTHPLAHVLRDFVADIESLKEGEALDLRPADYETCPRQYQFFREYDFTPSRSAVIFFGLLVHQTIEELHRLVLDGQLATLNEARIRTLFEQTFSFLSLSDVRPIGDAAREAAFAQVMNYFRQNRDEMKRVIETEVDVSVELAGYILTGKVDLLMGGDGRLELLDFKTSPKPVNSPALLVSYERQLCTYAHILERRHGKRPDRLLLYWTAEPRKQDALMEFLYRPERVEEAGAYFDQVVRKILRKDFTIQQPPERKICKECDFRGYCHREGVIQLMEDEV